MDIVGNNIYLRILSSADVGDKYVEWMRDEETVSFLESRWKTYTMVNLWIRFLLRKADHR